MFIEGEGQAGEIQQGAVNEGSPSSSETQQAPTSPAPGANTGSETVPFHKQPGATEYIERQRKNWERDSERKYSEQSERTKQEWESRYKQLESKLNNSGSTMSEDNKAQLRQLSQLLSSDPEARKMLGLDSVSELQEKLSRYEQGNTMSQFNSELNEVSDFYANDYGLDKKEVEYDLLEFVQTDPLWSKMGNEKGVLKKASKDFFSDKREELAERKANMKLVNEQKNKGKVTSQRPANGVTQELPPPKSMREAIERSAKAAGVKI